MTTLEPLAQESSGVSTGRLVITVRTGVGTGPTELAAFDAALRQAGIADRNLIVLSSVIPPGSSIVTGTELQPCPGDWGDRLYVVMAEQRVSEPGDEAWAGIGWVQDPENGAGLFVEHQGTSEAHVKTDLVATLASISEARVGRTWANPMIVTEHVICREMPSCALVVAAFQADPWSERTVDLTNH